MNETVDDLTWDYTGDDSSPLLRRAVSPMTRCVLSKRGCCFTKCTIVLGFWLWVKSGPAGINRANNVLIVIQVSPYPTHLNLLEAGPRVRLRKFLKFYNAVGEL